MRWIGRDLGFGSPADRIQRCPGVPPPPLLVPRLDVGSAIVPTNDGSGVGILYLPSLHHPLGITGEEE